MQFQYPWNLAHLGIEAALRTPLRRVPFLLTIVRCPDGRIPEDSHAGKLGNNLLQKLQSFTAYLRGKRGQTSDVSPGRARLATNPLLTGSLSNAMTMGIVQLLPWQDGLYRTTRDDNIYLETHQLGRKLGQSIEFSLRISVLNDNVFPLHVAEFPQTLSECLGAGRLEEGTRRYPIRGTFFGCCASAMTATASSTAPPKIDDQRTFFIAHLGLGRYHAGGKCGKGLFTAGGNRFVEERKG